MTKKRSRSLFVVFSIILVILLIASFVNFTYPFSINGNYYSWSNFVTNISLGEDIGSSYRIVYRAEIDDNTSSNYYEDLRQSTIEQLREIVQSEGYKDASITTYNDDGIVVQVGNLIDYDDQSDLVSLLGDPDRISFSMSDDVDESFATWKDVKSIDTGSYYNTTTGSEDYGETVYYVQITFKDSAVDKVAEATEDGGTIYVFFGDNDSKTQQISLSSSAITNGLLQLSFSTMEDANSYANSIKTGMLNLKLTTIDSGAITPSYGIGAGVLLCIAMAVFALIAFVFLIVKYKQMGWLACFNLLFFIVLGLFFLQSIPLVHVNFAGMLAMLICFITAIDGLMTIFEKAKYYYNSDVKLSIAFRKAQNESLVRIIAKNVVLIVLGFVCMFMPATAIQSAGWVMFVLSLLNLFTNLVLMRLFINMYLPFNNTDGKKLNFHKGGKNA